MFVRPFFLFLYAVLISATLDVDSNEPTSVPSTQHGSFEEGSGDAAAASARPNLLVIMTDQQRWDAMGFVQGRIPGYANKVKIKTPNLDELVRDSVDFSTAYCVCPLCVPARASLHTGNTMKRTGMSTIQLMLPEYYRRMSIFKERIENLTSLERVLSVEMNYTVELYGKYHLPWPLAKHPKKDGSVFQYDSYSFEKDLFSYEFWDYFEVPYRQNVLYLLERDGVKPPKGPLINYWTTFGYTPVPLDPRYGQTVEYGQPITKGGSYGYQIGWDGVSAKYSPSAVLGEIGVKALNRLIDDSKPFALTVNFNAPHAPYISPNETMEPYMKTRGSLYIDPSISDNMKFSAYKYAHQRASLEKLGPKYKWNKPEYIRDWVAAYYGMIEDTDTWVGELMKTLKARGQWDNTMIVFTSDHGEMLGAHGFGGKQVLLEEAIRIPLIMKLPVGAANRVRRVDVPVSHLDIFSTVLDYLGAPASADRSDGRSLRRFIENLSYNERWDEEIVVCEYDERNPNSTTKLTGVFGSAPGFSIRKGQFKLILPRKATSTVIDMMYDLRTDPGEVRNLLSRGAKATDAVVGKAEHLKALLVDYMSRLNGPGYYSNRRYNNNEGRGDITEVHLRRTWRRVPFWLSDMQLKFGQLVEREPGVFVRYEYLYLGRTTSGPLTLRQFSLSGPAKGSFSIDPLSSWPVRARTIGSGQYRRIQVRFQSSGAVDTTQVVAYLTIATSAGTKVVRLGG